MSRAGFAESQPHDNEMKNIIFNDYNWNKWKISE